MARGMSFEEGKGKEGGGESRNGDQDDGRARFGIEIARSANICRGIVQERICNSWRTEMEGIGKLNF